MPNKVEPCLVAIQQMCLYLFYFQYFHVTLLYPLTPELQYVVIPI